VYTPFTTPLRSAQIKEIESFLVKEHGRQIRDLEQSRSAAEAMSMVRRRAAFLFDVASVDFELSREAFPAHIHGHVLIKCTLNS
jgi:hypothetical protein